MRVTELTAFVVKVPLRKEFKHASHSRRSSNNILIHCRLHDGHEGWGEGVPRTYVTGETSEGSLAQLAATPLAEQFDRDCSDWDDVFDLCARIEPMVGGEDKRGCAANSLRCAIELSILDAYCRLFGEPLSNVTKQFSPAQPVHTCNDFVRYSGGVTATAPRRAALNAFKNRAFGFAHCKVKVGVPEADDPTRLRAIRRWLGPRIDIRLDANESWSGVEAASRLEPLTEFNISCIEQPVPHEEVNACAELRRQLPIPVMLDESLTSLVDGENAIRDKTCDLFNIRLSKCGGFLNSLRLAAQANSAGLGYQLGCHPGETGILSAAGRHFASSVRDIRYREGSYDRILLRDNVINENITFGYGGRAPALREPGLGVTINPVKLNRLTVRQQQYQLG